MLPVSCKNCCHIFSDLTKSSFLEKSQLVESSLKPWPYHCDSSVSSLSGGNVIVDVFFSLRGCKGVSVWERKTVLPLKNAVCE